MVENDDNLSEELFQLMDDAEPEGIAVVVAEEDRLTLFEVSQVLAKIKINCSALGIPYSAVVDLEKFAREVDKVKASKKKRSTTLDAFFTKKPKQP